MSLTHTGHSEEAADTTHATGPDPGSPAYVPSFDGATDRGASLAAVWVLIMAFVGLAIARSSGVVATWIGALIGGGIALVIGTIAVAWAAVAGSEPSIRKVESEPSARDAGAGSPARDVDGGG